MAYVKIYVEYYRNMANIYIYLILNFSAWYLMEHNINIHQIFLSFAEDNVYSLIIDGKLFLIFLILLNIGAEC